MGNMKVVEESNFGVYVWRMDDGRIVTDDELSPLNIPSERGDLSKIKMLTDAARHYGIISGGPVFVAGSRRVTEDEYAEQKQRLAWGLTPDIYDAGALKDELAHKKAMGNG
jgi:hypothetical protein